MAPQLAIRASLLHFPRLPAHPAAEAEAEFFADGILWVKDGRVKAVGEAAGLLRRLPRNLAVRSCPGCLVTPGFVDAHIHFPQTEVVASHGAELLQWLEAYTFPAERKFSNPIYAAEAARFFLAQLLRNGTTTALVFATVHKESVEAFFREAEARNMRMIAGKVLMDRNAPEDLRDTADSGYRDSRALIEKWHGRSRLHYAVTPRFAVTSSAAQLSAAGKLLREFPGVRLHTHLSENRAEVELVARLFPEAGDYLDVYDRHGLVCARSVFAHGIHLCGREYRRLAEAGSALASSWTPKPHPSCNTACAMRQTLRSNFLPTSSSAMQTACAKPGSPGGGSFWGRGLGTPSESAAEITRDCSCRRLTGVFLAFLPREEICHGR